MLKVIHGKIIISNRDKNIILVKKGRLKFIVIHICLFESTFIVPHYMKFNIEINLFTTFKYLNFKFKNGNRQRNEIKIITIFFTVLFFYNAHEFIEEGGTNLLHIYLKL